MIRNSTTMMKIKGEIMSPWGTPCLRKILFVRCPPIRIIASLSLNNKDTHQIISSPKFKFSMVFLIKSWLMLSKGFLKSINRIRPSIFLLLQSSIRAKRLRRTEPMFSFATSAFFLFANQEGNCFFKPVADCTTCNFIED